MFTHFPTRKTLDTSTCHAGDARHHDGAWETEGAGSSAVPWQGVLDLGMTGVTKICFALRKWDGWYKKHICTESVSPYVGFKRSGPWILDLHAFGSLNSFCFLRGKNQWGWWLNKCYLDGRRRHFGYILGWCTRWVWFRLQNHRLKGRMDQPIVDFGWKTPWFIEYWVTRIDLGEKPRETPQDFHRFPYFSSCALMALMALISVALSFYPLPATFQDRIGSQEVAQHLGGFFASTNPAMNPELVWCSWGVVQQHI